MYGLAMVMSGLPSISTRDDGMVGVAVPACEQVTEARWFTMKAGMPDYRITWIAPRLMSTEVPVKRMLAPAPLSISIPASLIAIFAPPVV